MRKMASALWSTIAGGEREGRESGTTPNTASEAPAVQSGPGMYVPATPYVDTQPRTLRLVATLEAHRDRVWGIAWHPSGQLFASCGSDKAVRLWSRRGGADDCTASWTCIAELPGEHHRTVRHLEWSPDGSRLAAASFDATVSIWRRASLQFDDMQLEAVLDGHESEVKCISWAHDGTAIASCARDKTIQIWDDAAAGTAPLVHRDVAEEDDGDDDGGCERQYDCAAILQGHAQDVKTVRFHPDVRTVLLSGGYDDVVKVWEEVPGRKDDWHCVQTLVHHESTVWGLAFQPAQTSSPNGGRPLPRLCASCSDDSSVAVWWLVDDSADRPQGVFAARWALAGVSRGVHEGGAIFSVDWCPTVLLPNALGTHSVGPILATVGADESLIVYEIYDATADADDEAHMSNLPIGMRPIVIQRSAHLAEVNVVRFCPALAPLKDVAALIATGADDGTIRLWELTTVSRKTADV